MIGGDFVISLILVFVIIWFLWKLYVNYVERRFKSINNGKSIPGPDPSFLGLKEFLVYARGSIGGLLEKYGHYGPLIRVYVGPFVWILASDLQSYQALLSKGKAFQRGKMFQAINLITPGALFVTEGTEWRRHRLAMSPFFAEEEFDRFRPEIWRIVKEEFDEKEDGKSLKVKDFVRGITSRVLMKSLFNVSVNKNNAEELKRFNSVIGIIDDCLAPLILVGFLAPILLRTTFMKNLVNKKTASFKQVIKDMKENPDPDCLWQQMTKNDKFTWEEFENESIGLIAAGFDTTTVALCWIIHSLSKYPEVKSKLKQEIDSVLGGEIPTSEDIKRLPYLERVIFESIRYHPVGLFNNRTAIEQDSIGDYQIPKDSTLFACAGNAIRNSVDNPDIFDPERFSDENMKQFSRIAMSNFGGGPHMCIGKYLALFEIKLIIVYILQHGDIEVDLTTDEINPHFPLNMPTHLTATIKKHKNIRHSSL
jgi:cytochrome P450